MFVLYSGLRIWCFMPCTRWPNTTCLYCLLILVCSKSFQPTSFCWDFSSVVPLFYLLSLETAPSWRYRTSIARQVSPEGKRCFYTIGIGPDPSSASRAPSNWWVICSPRSRSTYLIVGAVPPFVMQHYKCWDCTVISQQRLVLSRNPHSTKRVPPFTVLVSCSIPWDHG